MECKFSSLNLNCEIVLIWNVHFKLIKGVTIIKAVICCEVVVVVIFWGGCCLNEALQY